MASDKTARKGVSHFSIFNYWKDKIILSNGEIVDKCNKPERDYEWVVWSNVEPSCWGCGLPVRSKIEDECRTINESDVPHIWNDKNVKSELNRCHIVPRSLGGEDAPENLFLMCEKCHCESPDTTNPRTFFRWVYDRRKTHSMGYLSMRAVYEMLSKEIERRGLNTTPVDIVKTICERSSNFGLNASSMNEYLDHNVGQHGFETNLNSLVSGCVDWLIHNYVGACLEERA